jgi:hypothetical protein
MAKWTMTEAQKAFRLLPREQKIELFWEQVDTSAGPDGCWEWQGARNKKGYGHFSLDGDNAAYRIAYRLVKGEITPGMRILHSCDNPPCCNPCHLSQGTHLDNMHDKIAKGRQWRGGPYPKKLPEAPTE